MNRTLKVGIISGNWGMRAHLPAWRALEDVEVVAVCTAHPETAEAAAEANGIELAYSDHREMSSNPSIDVIDVGTRPSLRHELVTSALEGGKHVVACVPLCSKAEQGEAMHALARSRRCRTAVDVYAVWTPGLRLMKELVDDGYLGVMHGATLNLQFNLFATPPAEFGYYWFADPANGASVLRNYGAHAFHPLVELFGEVSEVVGVERQFLDEWHAPEGQTIRPRVSDTATAILRMRSGALVTVNLSWAANGGSGFYLDAYGSSGRLTASDPYFFANGPNIVIRAARARVGSTPLHPGYRDEQEMPVPSRLRTAPGVADASELPPGPFLPMALGFLDLKRSIEEKRDPKLSFARAIHVMKTIEAIERSSASRSWEPVDSRSSTTFSENE